MHKVIAKLNHADGTQTMKEWDSTITLTFMDYTGKSFMRNEDSLNRIGDTLFCNYDEVDIRYNTTGHMNIYLKNCVVLKNMVD